MKYLENNLVPYYQPVVGVDSNAIYGFEVIDFYRSENGDAPADYSDCTDEERALYGRVMRKMALMDFSEQSIQHNLFLKMDLACIESYTGNPSELPLVHLVQEYGIDASKIVIQISQADFEHCSDKCILCISNYKSAGFKIAVNDYGSGDVSIDALVMLSPDIIKLAPALVHKSEQHYQHREYMNILIEFAQKLGIETVYVGVENESQLDICMSFQGRYYQGDLLCEPLKSMEHAGFNDQLFKFATYKSIANHQLSAVDTKKLYNFLNNAIDKYFETNPYDNFSIDEYLTNLASVFSSSVIRIYVCNKYGYQISSNVEIGTTVSLINYKNRNWAWRKYFINALKVIINEQESYLSDEYRDVTTKEKLYTFIRKVSPDDYLFIDVLKNV